MDKLDAKKDGSTTNVVEENVARLKELFPDVFTEGKIDFDALRETLGDYVDDRQERYSFTWNGKSSERCSKSPTPYSALPSPCCSVPLNSAAGGRIQL